LKGLIKFHTRKELLELDRSLPTTGKAKINRRFVIGINEIPPAVFFTKNTATGSHKQGDVKALLAYTCS
jgi:hypothetical protein